MGAAPGAELWGPGKSTGRNGVCSHPTSGPIRMWLGAGHDKHQQRGENMGSESLRFSFPQPSSQEKRKP